MTTAHQYHILSQRAAQQGEWESAERVLTKALNEHPYDIQIMQDIGRLYKETGRHGLAAVVLERAARACPEDYDILNSYGQALLDYACLDDQYGALAEEYFRRALALDENRTTAYVNLSYLFLHQGRYDEAAAICKKAISLDPEKDSAYFNLSIAFLTMHMWEEGWYCYDKTLDARYKKVSRDYHVPLWDGSEGKRVVIAGEQGLGDQIMFASMIPDVMKDADIVIDVDKRLEGLFSRSFGCEVRGTLGDDAAPWKRDPEYDAWLPMGSLGAFYRTKHEDFPRKPYLTPDPQRRIQWRALFDSLGRKPKIGIAWSGGIDKTYERKRSLSLRQMHPLLEFDAEWVSLQYKNVEKPDFVHYWERASKQTADCDENAALISELDLVITVTTTVAHMCGAVGTEAWVLVPKEPAWRYGTTGDKLPWYGDNVTLYRQEEEWPIRQLSEKLSAMGIERCRNLSISTPITVKPPVRSTPPSSEPSSEKSVLLNALITGLGRVPSLGPSESISTHH